MLSNQQSIEPNITVSPVSTRLQGFARWLRKSLCQNFAKTAFVALVGLSVVSCGANKTVKISGAGASFPALIYEDWFTSYNKLHPNVQVNYQSLGSGAGVQQFIQHIVNFGASDAAMTDDEIAQVPEGVVMLPMTAGSVVLAYNLPGLEGKDLKLSRKVYSDIFLGKIKKWNDPAIAEINPGVALPDLEITTVHRSDGSGTTFVFTQHLDAISPEWNKGPGFGKSVDWPSGVGGKGNEGVAGTISQAPGSIGYLEYGFAEKSKVPFALLENKSGNYVKADQKSGTAALASMKLPANMRVWDPDPAGADAYPIVSYTWLLCYKKYSDAQIGTNLKEVIKWCVTDGQKVAPTLGYIPLPESVQQEVLKAVDTIEVVAAPAAH